MGADQRRKVEMLHNCTCGYAIGVFVSGKPMKKRDVDYTAIQRGFMTAHKPAKHGNGIERWTMQLNPHNTLFRQTKL
jgi:hypothetical protein